MEEYHKSVLLNETIEALNIKPGEKFIDATLGGGGHTGAILDRGGIVLGIDTDRDALDYIEEKFKIQNSKFKIGKDLILTKGNFKDIDKIAQEFGFDKVAGAVFDLGVSSHQLETAERGFSFQSTGPLDMRMDRDLSVKAADLINILTKGELYELFNKLGEERFARTISESIVSNRRINPIQTTSELVEIVRSAVPKYKHNINPATKVFQALRIAINDELNNLREALPKALALLNSNGRLAVISFHSLEDRIVKNQFKQFDENGLGRIITKKPLSPSLDEIESNKRSRSAKLRVIEKI